MARLCSRLKPAEFGDPGQNIAPILAAKVVYDRVVPRWAKLGLWVLLVGAAPICARHAWAHHSFAGTYSSETVTIQGTVVEFLFRNPHSLVLVEASAEKNKTVKWAAEWGTAGQLSRLGIESDTLQPGDRVIISGNPSRNSADHRLRIGGISRPSDGWKWTSDY
jgi:hypothetical protein